MATIDALHSTDAQQPGPETQTVIKSFEQYVVPNYRRFNVCLVRGEGSRIWDADGHCYLDLFPGWGCNLLGHCPGPVVQAVQKQVEKLIHVPNTWYMEPFCHQIRPYQTLRAHTLCTQPLVSFLVLFVSENRCFTKTGSTMPGTCFSEKQEKTPASQNRDNEALTNRIVYYPNP